ncbi:MAG TPA: DUF3488 and transglutaminase-like domain-containing protein [Blastocatellia bacterium]|nr:DUF3488 and transglutaminase-like domain-containing protein [Blastocatellia bacterium]
MSFDAYFRLTSYGLVTTAFAALAVTGELDAISILLYGVALSASLYADLRGVTRYRLREWMWRVLAIAYVPFVFVDADFISTRVVALVHMTLFVSAVKLFQQKRDRDWVFLYLIAFFQMLLAAGLTFNASFVASLCVYIFFFVSTLAAFEIRRARREVVFNGEEVLSRGGRRGTQARPGGEEAGSIRGGEGVSMRPRGTGPQPPTRLWYLVGAAGAELAIVIMLALPLFFMIPRVGGNAFGSGYGEATAMTGFSNTVELGNLARIKTSSRVVMRVRLDRPPGRLLRWRGIALDHYDGRSWTISTPDIRTTRTNSGARASGGDYTGELQPVFDYPINKEEPFGSTASAPQEAIKQEIFLEPLNTGTGTLFAARRLVHLRTPRGRLRIQDTGAVFLDGPPGRISYTAWSDVRQSDEHELRLEPSSTEQEGVSHIYRQLPIERPLDPRVNRLAHEITQGLTNSYDKARAIETYLKTRFGYTLNLRPTEGDPLAEFLFETREGHCEYFATAMVLMLRKLGISARIVNGFQMGEYNDISGLYTVREHDAHSWVEAYLPGSRTWIEFDPTPSAGLNDYSQGGVVARLRKYLEAAEVFWMDYVVTLDRDQQANLMVKLQHQLLAIKDWIGGYYDSIKQWAMRAIASLLVGRQWTPAGIVKAGLLLGLLSLALVALYVLRSYRRLRGKPPTGYGPWWQRLFILPTWKGAFWIKHDQRTSAVLFYEQMLAIVARAGLIKGPDVTPLEFAAATGRPNVIEITRVYNSVRFGGLRLDDRETRRVAALLAELKKSTKRK